MDRLELNRREEIAVGNTDWEKLDGSIRIAFQNINGFGFDKEEVKFQRIFNFLAKYKIDKLGVAEANVFWPKINVKKRLWDRTRGWFEGLSINTAYNTNDVNISKRYQPGGVASFTTNKLAYKIFGKNNGQDESNLGRWVWTKYQGKDGKILRVVTVYRPVKTGGGGSQSTYKQHLRWLVKNKDDRDPRTALMEDLSLQIEEWRDKGESIVVMGDFNEDVRSNNMREWRESLGLREVLLDTVGVENAPSTFDKGKLPIDSIMCSANIAVTKAGYMPFGEGVGDHRPLMIDINERSVFGNSGAPSSKLRARKLKLNDPRIIKKYLHLLDKFYEKHHIYQKIYDLNQTPVRYPLQPQIATLYEAIDLIRVEGMRYAEKRCRKFHAGKIPWSPAVSAAQHNIELWTLVARRCRGCKVNTRTILRKKREAGYDGETNLTENDACDMLTQSYKEYRKVVKDGVDNRVSFINDLATAKAKVGKITASNALKQIQVNEEQRASWSRIHRMDGTARIGVGLTKVLSLDENGNLVERLTREDLEYACLQENVRRFTQTKGTPLTIGPLLEALGLLGKGEFADAIMKGTYRLPPGVDPAIQTVLDSLKADKNITICKQPSPITCEEYKSGWKNVKERTSSSPSGLHVGHWKCGSLNPMINWLNTSMANIPFMSGYSPKRWKQGINVMIEKSKGNFRVDKLRTILLYEADFNLNNKYIGRDMMFKAEKAKILAKEQYGSRKKKAAITHALNKRLTFDILRQQRKKGGICSCDLKSCYDRIVHSFAALAMKRAGAAESATVSMFSTIQDLKHKVRTAFGDSDESFGGEAWRELEALMGVGQGNGAGPAIWAVISTIFFDTLRKNGFGALLLAPFSKVNVNLAGFGFVDDTDLLQTGLDTDEYWDIAAKLQASVQLWEKCTEVSGGCLVPEKSWWTLVDFTWTNGNWDYSKDMDDVYVSVKDSGGNLQQLKQLAADEAQKMLGVWLAPDGNNTKQVEEMRRTTVEWAEKVRTGAIDRKDVWQALTLTIMKKLEYPLLALTLTEDECDYIMSPILQSGLPRAGICRNIPRALLYGRKEHQGLGLNNLHTTMGITQVQVLLDNVWENTVTGDLIRVSMESLKLELGIKGSIFSHDFDMYGHLATNCWVKHLWKFVWAHSIEINDKVGEEDILRERDTMLTDKFATSFKLGLLNKRDWKAANKCRLYLKVLTIADIANGCGTGIDKNFLNGRWHQGGKTRLVKWPDQGNPSLNDWQSWRRVLKLTLCTGENNRLSIGLGRWHEEATLKNLPNWKWFWNCENKALYEKYNGTWKKYTSRQTGTRTRNGDMIFRNFTIEGLPNMENMYRTTVYKLPIGWRATGGLGSVQDVDVLNVDNSSLTTKFRVKVRELGKERWAARKILMTSTIDGIIESIKDGSAVGVSGGSFQHNIGTACWIIENGAGTERIIGLIDVPGNIDEHDAYRSELAGLYGIGKAVSLLEDIGHIESGKIEVGYDGLSALRRCFNVGSDEISSRQAHFDILSGMHGYLLESNLEWVPRHIKGHQDDISEAELDRWAHLNIECDLRAKDYLTEILDGYNIKKYNVPKGMWAIKICGISVGSNMMGYLRRCISGAQMFQYWVRKKKRIQENQVQNIDWETIGKAMKNSTHTRQQWVSKFSSGWCATGKVMKIWGKRLTSSCPRCNAPVEDTDHVLLCQAEGAIKEWNTSTDTLEEWLDSSGACPDLSILVLNIVKHYKLDIPIPLHDNVSFDGVVRVFHSQRRIGWRLFLDGCLSNEWAKVQQDFLTWKGSRKSGQKWVSQLICKLWDFQHAAWMHRCSILHDTPLAEIMGGSLALDRALRLEWNLGFVGFPNIVKAALPRVIGPVLEGSIEDKKGWFVLVRRTRENLGDNRIQDEFSDPKNKLRAWVGM